MQFISMDGRNWEERRNVTIGIMGGNMVSVRAHGSAGTTIIDLNEMKYTLQHIGKEWFGIGKGTLKEGVFWAAFMTYVFPWFLDIAKVYCAIMVCQAFYKERRGGSAGGDGRTGMQALVHYGKWFLIFNLIPWAVELIDQIGHKMQLDLTKKGLPNM